MNRHNDKMTLRRDVAAIGSIIIFTLLIILSCCSADTVYGSKTDWGSQHYAIPEYFRTLFYSTHELFPSYAPHIGGDENIYSLSYYGLLSPLMIPSYFLPFVSMGKYIMVTSILAALFSEVEMYLLIRKRYTTSIAFMTVLFFALSTPLILNTHRQIMFTSYMPFLLLSFHGAEFFFRTGKRTVLAFGTFLTVMCNYFFATSAVLALVAYGIWLILEKEGRPDLKKLIPYITYIGIGILSAAILILPTAHELLSGRDVSECTASIKTLLPTLHFEKLTYFNSAMGLSAFGIFSALYLLIKGKRHQRFVSALVISFATMPLVLYILNGTLYTDPKVLFPFLPLALTLPAEMLSRLNTLKSSRSVVLFMVISVAAFFANGMTVFIGAYLADSAIVSAALYTYIRTQKKRIICTFFIFPFAVCLFGNHYDKLTTKSNYDTANSETVSQLISELPQNELYRTAVDTSRLYTVNKVYTPNHYQDTLYSSIHSQDYNRFYFNEMSNENEYRNSALTTRTRNILFNSFMGDRYYITNSPVNYYGLEKIKETSDGYFLYENKNAFPMIYFNKDTMSQRQYSSLGFPDRIDALMHYTIVPEDIPDVDFHSELVPVDIGNIFESTEVSDENGESIITTENGSGVFSYELPESVRGKLLVIRFYVSDPQIKGKFCWETNDDIRIKINGIKNTLSNPDWKYFNHNNYFEYIISDMPEKLDIEITGNNIKISDIRAYTLETDILEKCSSQCTAFKPHMEFSTGDNICGNITAETDGYFCTSLVYQKGFTILVDGEPVIPQKINTAFLGFPISKGSHNVEIHFRAPLINAGKALSALGASMLMLCLIIDIIFDKKLMYALLRNLFGSSSSKKRGAVHL